VRRKAALATRPGVELVLDVDGFGNQAEKIAKYRELTRGARRFPHGIKLFFREDTNLMSPREALALRPQPQLVVYE